MKKNKKQDKTLFIDASEEYVRGSAKNKLTQKNIDKILECFAKRNTIEHFSRLVDNDEIRQNDYNISVSTYVTQEDTSEDVDIDALEERLENIVGEIDKLREDIGKIVKKLRGLMKNR